MKGRLNDFDIGDACLTSAKGASVKGESTRGGAPLSMGVSPEKMLKFMTPVDAFWAIAGTFCSNFSSVNLSHLCAFNKRLWSSGATNLKAADSPIYLLWLS